VRREKTILKTNIDKSAICRQLFELPQERRGRDGRGGEACGSFASPDNIIYSFIFSIEGDFFKETCGLNKGSADAYVVQH